MELEVIVEKEAKIDKTSVMKEMVVEIEIGVE